MGLVQNAALVQAGGSDRQRGTQQTAGSPCGRGWGHPVPQTGHAEPMGSSSLKELG